MTSVDSQLFFQIFEVFYVEIFFFLGPSSANCKLYVQRYLQVAHKMKKEQGQKSYMTRAEFLFPALPFFP
jgi:hypothetical protein